MSVPAWTVTNRPVSGVVSDEDAADTMGNDHPKSKRVSVHNHFTVVPGSFPGSGGGPGAGSAPGASGPPTTGAIWL